MIRDIYTVDSKVSIRYAAQEMSRYDTNSLMVFSGETLVGIISERDIVHKIVACGCQPEAVPVKEIMSSPVIVVDPLLPLIRAVSIMLREKVKKLPVVYKDEECCKLLGVVSLHEIARLHPNHLEGWRSISLEEDLLLEAQSVT